MTFIMNSVPIAHIFVAFFSYLPTYLPRPSTCPTCLSTDNKVLDIFKFFFLPDALLFFSVQEYYSDKNCPTYQDRKTSQNIF